MLAQNTKNALKVVVLATGTALAPIAAMKGYGSFKRRRYEKRRSAFYATPQGKRLSQLEDKIRGNYKQPWEKTLSRPERREFGALAKAATAATGRMY